MSSHTSNSDDADDATSRLWVRVFLGILLVASGTVYALLLLTDPYDSGRFPNLGLSGILDDNPRTADASRGRDPNFNAAILGNSTGQLVDPQRLSAATGLSFVQLTVPGSGPPEQLAVLHWFLVHHPHVGALVVVADDTWCTSDAELPLTHPFPFWLYGSDLDYLGNAFSPHSFSLALRRLEVAWHLRAPSRPDGYSDYEAGKTVTFVPEPMARQDIRSSSDSKLAFPGIERLGAAIADLSPALPLVLVMPPIFSAVMPPPGSDAAVALAQCKAALGGLVAQRPNSGFIDFQIDDAMTRDPNNFLDGFHYRGTVARKLEAAIAATIGSRGPG
jgi:hypothetical protein